MFAMFAHARRLAPRTLWIALLLVPLAPARSPALTGDAAIAPLPDLSRLARRGPRTIDLQTGFVVSEFQLAAGPFSGAPEQQARAYLRTVAAAYGFEPALDDLEPTVVQHGPWADIVRFEQRIAGIPVLGSDVVVTIRRRDGRVASVMSRYRPGTQALATAATYGPESASARALDQLGVAGERALMGTVRTRLVLWPGSGPLLPLVYRVVVPATEPLGDWEVILDATSGAILRVRDQALSVDGTGLSFDPDPLTTAEVAYGTPGYTDGGDANTPELAAETFVRPLRDLSFTGGVYHLEGPHCKLLDFESPSSPPVTAPDPDGFHFTRNQQGFEDVLVYYGIDSSQRWIQSLGFNTIQNTPIECDPHGLNGADNSHYIPSQNRLAWGEGGVDDAEDMDVVLHEYGHAIQHGQVPGWGGGHEGAMGEGFGDYWAGSYSAAISAYRDEWVFNWDGHNPFWPGRRLDYTATYPGGLTGSIHTDGQIWSSNLMLVWHETCREVVDRATLDHHWALGSSATMAQAAEAWVQSDVNLHDGLNVDSFVYFSTLRGFFAPGQYDIPQTSHTPLGDTGSPGPYMVTMTVTSVSNVSSAELRYGTGGVIDQAVAMAPTGQPDEWSAEIPSQGASVTISYYAVAQNTAGWKATEPRSAPCGAVHSFDVTGSTALLAAAAPGRNVLEVNRPNPFNPSTTIRYSLAASGPVQLVIYDVRGAVVRVLVDQTQAAERFSVHWDGRDARGAEVASGVYTYRLDAPGYSASRKMILLK